MIINPADDKESTKRTILALSRGTAIILLILYVMYLFFQLKTHHNLFSGECDSDNASQNGSDVENHNSNSDQHQDDEDDKEDSEEHMSPWSAGVVLIFTTILVAICADYLVDSIDALVERAHISRNFIGLILIPIVGNAAEHVTAVVVAIKNKMDLVSSGLAALALEGIC